MFRIADGRECFYQWDLDRQIIVEDPTITEVHFCNRTDECSLVVEVEETTIFADAKEFMTLRTANVPNVILQKSFDIRVFGYDGKATRHDEVFKVKARTKPTDYVYTETEVKNYDALAARVDEIEKNGISEEAITGAVEDYLEKNPVNLDGYATEEYVDEAVKNIDLTGYATEAYVDEAISNITIEIPEGSDIDLTGYATEKWVKDQGYAKETDLASYATRTELNNVSNSIPTKVSQLSNDKNYLTKHQDISHLATIGQVQNVESKIPTKTSQLTNDSGYLTEHQDLSGKADKVHTHPSYALKTEIPSVDGLATEKYVDDAIAGIELSGENQGVYELVLPEVEGIVTDEKTIECLNTAYNTAIPLCSYDKCLVTQRNVRSTVKQVVLTAVKQAVVSDSKTFHEYDLTFALNTVTGTWTFISVDKQARKHFTNVSELENDANFATEEYVNEAIANIEIPESGESADLSNYYTKSETYHKDEVYNRTEVQSMLAALPGTDIDPDNYYTKSEADNNYYPKNKGQANEAAISEVKATYASKVYVDNAIANIDIPEGGSADLSGCAKHYSIVSLANPSEAEYNKLKEIVAAGELKSYEFTIGGKYKPLTIWPLGNGEIVFVYGVFEGATNNNIYAYRVNPTAATSSLFLNYKMTSTEDVTQIVNDALAASGGGGSGSDSAIKVVTFVGYDYTTLENAEEAAQELQYLCNYYFEHNGATPPDRIYYVKESASNSRISLVSHVTCDNFGDRFEINLWAPFDTYYNCDYRVICSMDMAADGTCAASIQHYTYMSNALQVSVPTWYKSTNPQEDYWNLYYAKELYILVKSTLNSSYLAYSYFICEDYLSGETNGDEIPFVNLSTVEDDSFRCDSWRYDGSDFVLSNTDFEIVYIMYKT